MRRSPAAAALGGLMLLALLVAVSGTTTLPPDEHEVLVLRTTEEMAARGDWVVPYFNGEPRLNKPPLSYWLTGAVAAAAGDGGTVRPWHGRAVSVAAALGLVVLIYALGARFYGRATATLAAGLLVSTAAFFSFSHDARPDLLYALCCTLGLACFVRARLDAPPAAAGRWLAAMWTSFALATLAKGPHVPGLMLLGFVAWQWRDGGRIGPALRALHLPLGLLLVGAVAGSWWWWLQRALPADAVAGSQLGGSLLRPGLTHLWNGYYLYRPLQLVAPWVLLPLAWWGALARDGERPRLSPLLAWTLGAVVAGLSLGPQQRYFYLLPLWPAMTLLGARGAVVLAGRLRWLAWLQLLAAALAAVGLLVHGGQPGPALAAVLAALAAGVVAWRWWREPVAAAAAAAVLLVGLAFAAQGDGGVLWSEDRRHKARLAAAVASSVPPEAALVAYRLTPAVYVYLAGRTIPAISAASALDAAVAQAGDGLYALMPVETAAGLGAGRGLEALALMPAGADDRAGLYRVRGVSEQAPAQMQ